MLHISSFCSAAACQLCPYCQHTDGFDPTAFPLSLHAERISSGSHSGIVSVNELCEFFFFFVLCFVVEVQILGLDTVECVLFLNVCLLQKMVYLAWMADPSRVSYAGPYDTAVCWLRM